MDYQGIEGSGPNGRILKADVEGHQKSSSSKAAIGSPASLGIKRSDTSSLDLYEDTDLTNIRKVIAERLTFSKQNIPHYYVTI